MSASRITGHSFAISTSAARRRLEIRPPPSRELTTTTNPAWKSSTDGDGIVWLTLDKPDTSANVLSSEVLIELDAVLLPLQQKPPRGIVIMSAKKSGFIAGADIKEFTAITDPE